MKGIRKGEFAKRKGISAARVSQYIRDGILQKCILPDGRLDLELAEQELRSNRDPLKCMDYKLRSDTQRSRKKKIEEQTLNFPDLHLDFSEFE